MPKDRDLERELEESEALRRGMLATAPAGIAHILADGAFQFANAEALRILDMTEEELSARVIEDWAPMTIREDGSPFPVEDYSVTITLKTGQPAGPKTIGLRHADGKIIWCVFRAAPLKDAETGETTGAVLGFLDVTDQVNVRRSLHDHQAKLAAIMSSAPNIIFTMTPEGRFTFMNRTVASVEEIVDTSSIVGQSMFDWLNPRDHEMVRAKIRRVVDHGETVHYDLAGLDGVDPNAYMTNLGPVWREGKVGDLVGIISVITELKRAEADRIRLAAELHESQRLEGLGRLAGGVAHDFNNLLTIVQANVDLLLSARSPHELSASDGGDAQRIRERVGEIGDAARRAASLTRQLLAFGRKQELVPQTIDLRALVQGITPLLRRLVAEHTNLDIVTAHGVGPVHADPVELERVIVNLVMNAEDAMPNGGAITLSTHALMIDAPREGLTAGPHVVLEVRDTGTGMEEDTLAHAFEPFFTTKAVGRGTGLGLATVHGIVRQSGGAIEIDTRLGQGTTVRVILPEAFGVVETTAATVIPPSAEVHRRTILLVEDEAAVRNVTQLLLEGNGYDVIAPVSSLNASKISGDALARVDLLITDVVMPDLSGTTLAARLRERAPHLPVLLMSGHMRESAAAATDGYRFIAKPFDEKSLLRAVRAALAIESVQQATV